MSGYYAIASGLPAMQIAAEGILGVAEETSISLPDIRIFVPSRRAALSLRKAFLRAGDGRVMLLPRILPLGDIDGDELALMTPAIEDGVPPPIDATRRRLLLARLLLKAQEAQSGDINVHEALALAGALAKFLDEAEEEGADLKRLDDLVTGEFAEHWEKTLKRLRIVAEVWPGLRDKLGVLDPAARRRFLLAAQIALWRERPPRTPVYTLGIVDPRPATINFLKMVAGLPQGAVLLTGIDSACDETSWQALSDSPAHPRYEIHRLLALLGLDRPAIPAWPACARHEDAAAQSRRRLWHEALRPQQTVGRWDDLAPGHAAGAGFEGLHRIDFEHSEDEAFGAALLMRQALETPGRTAALVTPDRILARRTAAHLIRWGIEVDDSAGQPLALTPTGIFLKLTIDWLRAGSGATDLLSLFKHPLAAAGLAPAECRARIRLIEKLALRGPRLTAGLAGALAALQQEEEKGKADAGRLWQWLSELRATVDGLTALLGSRAATLADILPAHLALAEDLARSDSESGAERLWRGMAGEAAQRRIEEALAASDALGSFAGADYPEIFSALIADVMVREAYGKHPRLSILGPIEARFSRADIVILGALNEGAWPAQAPADPWLSRPMRRQLGLPPPEQAQGRSAADFVTAASAERVYLTRARRVDGAPALASRWLLRLDAVAERMGWRAQLYAQPAWLAAALTFDHPACAARPIAPPCPAPPVKARPRKFGVTEIARWDNNPYEIYARRILDLAPLPPIDDVPDHQERGTIIHDILARFMVHIGLTQKPLPADARAVLHRVGRQLFAPLENRPGIMGVWWPRFLAAADWFLETEAARRAEGWSPLAIETKGHMTLPAPAGDITLIAKADRIDSRSRDGALAILDYKTGTPPGEKELREARAPQLPLEAAMIAANAFPDIAPAPIVELAYMKLSGTQPPGLYLPWPDIEDAQNGADAAGDILAAAARARDKLLALCALFDDERTAYHAAFSPSGDYAHLARFAEWSTPAADSGDES